MVVLLSLLSLLYLLRLVITYFLLRSVYIKEPYLVDFVIILFWLVPIVGLFVSIVFLPYFFTDFKRKRILDYIFRVNK